MEVKCINNVGCALTLSGEYKAVQEDETSYKIRNDIGNYVWYDKERFEEVLKDVVEGEKVKKVRCKQNIFDFEKGKEYEREETESGNGYRFINDKGIGHVFFKTDGNINNIFEEVENPVLVINEIEFYKNGNIKVSVSKEEYEKNVEGEKMEEVIKVRCIDAKESSKLNLYKIYTVRYETNESYGIGINDEIIECLKDRFEKVTDDVLMVECIDNKEFEGDLSKGEKYKVIEDSGVNLKVKNDRGNVQWYRKNRFKLVEPPKEEKKEYTFKEVIENIKDGEMYKYSDIIIKQVNGAITICKEKAFSDGETLVFWFYNMYKFTKVEPKQVSFIEAWKALEEGKVIESAITNDRYSKEKDIINIEPNNHKGKGFAKCVNISTAELEGKWIIIE